MTLIHILGWIAALVATFWAGYETGRNIQLDEDLETIEAMKEEELES